MANQVDYLPFATDPTALVDSQISYQGSGYQTTGFQVGIAQPSQVNKVLRQASMGAAAVANFIANILNLSVFDDGNLPVLTANLTTAIQQAQANVITVPYSAAPVFDASQGQVFETTLTGNMNPTLVNARPGQLIRIIIHQDAVGGHVFTPPPNLPMAGIDPGANATSSQLFQVNAAGGLTPMAGLIVS
jgi:hypothetical protein